MHTTQFILARTGAPLSLESKQCDTAGFRGELVERFAQIHDGVTCEHSPGEGYLLANAVLKLKAVGPVVECGCYRGGMTAKLSLACAAAGRELYVCDSFDGLPKPRLYGGLYRHYANRGDLIGLFGEARQFEAGDYRAALPEVRENVAKFGNVDVCRFVPGPFAETLPKLDIRPAMVTIDVDLVESARDCLRWLWPRLVGRRFFTHEAFYDTFMKGILDPSWWQATMNEDIPKVLGAGTGLNPRASCTAVLMKRG
ncbi:MAG TPA: TylF/MycF/NovP-related O-methyltransferase [Pirellulaceae bacterium]|nr:TylF/MycF/NovP-related O-methyltransferase [Pirellulaceae bacterium]